MTPDSRPLPHLIVCKEDHQRLLALLGSEFPGRHARSSEVLSDELERAEVVPADELPADVVSMGSRVVYSGSDGVEHEAELVYPEQASSEARRISIVSPLGASLIGLRVGARFDWHAPNGQIHRLTVVNVKKPART